MLLGATDSKLKIKEELEEQELYPNDPSSYNNIHTEVKLSNNYKNSALWALLMEKTTNETGSATSNKEEHKNDPRSSTSSNYGEEGLEEFRLANLEELGAFTGFNFPDVPVIGSSYNFDENDIRNILHISGEVADILHEKSRVQEKGYSKLNMNLPPTPYSNFVDSSIILQNNIELKEQFSPQNRAEITNLPPVAHPDKIRPPNQKSSIVLSRERKYILFIGSIRVINSLFGGSFAEILI